MSRERMAEVGVFGGSGFYEFLDDAVEYEIDTPWGAPSAPLVIGEVGDRRVAFLPRHGVDHRFPPHSINYRANIDAMRQAGVGAIFGPCAAGSLRADIAPGHFVVVDQFVDRTWGRPDSFWDEGDTDHVAMADPYDPDLRAVAVRACTDEGVVVHDGGTVVVIQGPRFATRAESRWYREQGWDVINMTQVPEAPLAKEARIPYATIALVTDYDSGLEGHPDIEPVTQEQIFAFFRGNIDSVRKVLFRAIATVPSSLLD